MESEARRLERLRNVPTYNISSFDCALCQQLRGQRQRPQRYMQPCRQHGTKDLIFQEK